MVALAVSSAMLWGLGNFSMGMSARLGSPRATVVTGFATGTLLAILFLGIQRPELSWIAVTTGLGAGVAQGLGWMLFARSLTACPMAVAAPTAAMTTVFGLVGYAALRGSIPSGLQFLGIVLCLGAVFLLSRNDVETGTSASTTGVRSAVGAGALFAAQAGFLAEAPPHATSAVMVSAGAGVLAAMAIAAVVAPIRVPPRRSFVLGAAGGIALFVGDAAFILALSKGNIALGTAIGQLHPLATALAAAVLVRERPTLAQVAGLGLAVAAVLTMSS